MKNNIVEVTNLKKHFKVSGKRVVKAVDGISFTIREGETFSLVGESGSGKSTTGRTIIKLYEPTDGTIIFEGKDISAKLRGEEKKAVARDMQMIFQDPYASLNPRMNVEEIVSEGLTIHFPKMTKKEKHDKVVELLKTVGLAEYHINRYPHEFSGGQLQRIGIARALAVDPKLIIADEAISALDVSIQAQVVNLLSDLQEQRGLTYLFIAHDLSMVRYISDRIGVMHYGRLVEYGNAELIYENPIHPYTKSLLSAVPIADPIVQKSRKRHGYVKLDYDAPDLELIEVEEDHFVLGSKEDVEKWTNEKVDS